MQLKYCGRDAKARNNKPDMYVKQYAPLQCHPKSKGQGYKEVEIDSVWKYLTKGICILNTHV